MSEVYPCAVCGRFDAPKGTAKRVRELEAVNAELRHTIALLRSTIAQTQTCDERAVIPSEPVSYTSSSAAMQRPVTRGYPGRSDS